MGAPPRGGSPSDHPFDLPRPRPPLAVSNDRGEVALLTANVEPQEEERFLCNFATRSGGQAYVVGYPLTRGEFERAVETDTVTPTLDAGRLIMRSDRKGLQDAYGVRSIFTGTIERLQKRNTPGFLSFDAIKKNGAATARLYIKNEAAILSCSDLIVALDRSGRPLYNTELRQSLAVEIIGVRPAPRWQTIA
ncbi:MAG: hypothetical protein RL417_182 [Pseudomonadota bacterium]